MMNLIESYKQKEFTTVEELRTIVESEVLKGKEGLIKRWSGKFRFPYRFQQKVFVEKYMSVHGNILSTKSCVKVLDGEYKKYSESWKNHGDLKPLLAFVGKDFVKTKEDMVEFYISNAFEYIFEDIVRCAKYAPSLSSCVEAKGIRDIKVYENLNDIVKDTLEYYYKKYPKDNYFCKAHVAYKIMSYDIVRDCRKFVEKSIDSHSYDYVSSYVEKDSVAYKKLELSLNWSGIFDKSQMRQGRVLYSALAEYLGIDSRRLSSYTRGIYRQISRNVLKDINDLPSC